MYILGDITLPTPKPGSFVRKFIEVGGKVTTLKGRTKKDIVARKEQFVIKYVMLTQTEVNAIMGEYNLEATRNFSISETNLTIASTPVHIDIAERAYNTAGDSYREDLTLVLTEVI